MKFLELKDGDRVVDIMKEDGKRVDGQILEYREFDGKKYLCSQRDMWEIFQFSENDYERYNGDKEVGEYM